MKLSILQTRTIFVLNFLLFFSSCKKEFTTSNSSAASFSNDQIAETDVPGISKTVLGYTKLVLQPGDDLGQDAWIDWYEGDPSYANGNSGPIDQFKCFAWTINGLTVYSKALIRFDGISSIPAGSTVLYAKMFLHGLPSSPIHLPEGNSYYPNSPYNIYGPNDVYVQRITSFWNENSVTWNSQPSTSIVNESIISPSTSQWNYNASVDVSKLVRYFVNNPSKNYGFLLSLVNESPYHAIGFHSSECTDVTKRPKLVIIYKN